MPLKKKKYNARFPAGRIKKIMQSDEEVGKVAQAVPIIISRTLELFVESMLTKTMRITNARKSKTLSPSHMKQCIMSESRFDFLRELVKNIPDINVADEQQSDYPERRESSEDGSLSIKASVISNGLLSNPNGAASGSNSHWKFSKQLSVDSTVSKNHNYDNNTPLNYSIKIKVDDQPPPVKLLRMESTPASFGSNNNSAAPIVTPSFLPVTTAKLSDGDKPIINFDFTKIPLLPSAAITTNTATALTHSHSVSNILKLDNKSSETNELQSQPVKSTLRHAPSKPQLGKSSTITSSPPATSATASPSIPILSYQIPLSAVGTSSTLEMDEDYDNV